MRARHIAGSFELWDRFALLVDPLRRHRHADDVDRRRALIGIAQLLGLASGSELEEEHLRSARRARAVVDRLSYA